MISLWRSHVFSYLHWLSCIILGSSSCLLVCQTTSFLRKWAMSKEVYKSLKKSEWASVWYHCEVFIRSRIIFNDFFISFWGLQFVFQCTKSSYLSSWERRYYNFSHLRCFRDHLKNITNLDQKASLKRKILDDQGCSHEGAWAVILQSRQIGNFRSSVG